MPEQPPSPVFLDTTVVSNFASTDGIGILTTHDDRGRFTESAARISPHRGRFVT
jgi:hypothetical protein